MLVNFLISLGAVIAFAIFSYFQDKANYNIKTAWFKYVVALAVGTFGFSYLLKWAIFQDILLFAFIVALLYFFAALLKILKIKSVPGDKPLKSI
jgi:hypothetical protein